MKRPARSNSASGPTEIVRPYLPVAAVDHVARLLEGLAVDLRVVRPRRTKLGDHRPPPAPLRPHRITVNADLNPYAFLTTLLHEVAHAATWERHRGGFLRRRRLRPHGAEWKREFSAVLAPVVEAGVFPDDVATGAPSHATYVARTAVAVFSFDAATFSAYLAAIVGSAHDAHPPLLMDDHDDGAELGLTGAELGALVGAELGPYGDHIAYVYTASVSAPTIQLVRPYAGMGVTW
jgi:hypothetical protein